MEVRDRFNAEDRATQELPELAESSSVTAPGQAPLPPNPMEPGQEPAAPAHVRLDLEIPPGAAVQLTISSPPGQPVQISQRVISPYPPESAPALPFSMHVRQPFFRMARTLASRLPPLPTTLFVLAGIVYLATRLVGLSSFPIYFFTDEAVQTNLAQEFVANNFRDRSDEFFPAYFENAGQYEMSVSVYVQVLPYLLFGKSVFVTRLTSVLITLLGALALGLLLREGFDLPYWWSGVLVLSITPAWFLHSRTAFESAEAVALYACFLYFYMLYRFKAPRYLYAALVCGALSFYTYSPAQLVVVVTGLLLLLSDLRYHWRNRRVAVLGLGLLFLLAAPYARYLITHPTENTTQLRILHSYLLQSLPLREKLGHYFSEYAYGLSPGYWFIPNEHDIVRHLMLGYGHLLRASLPFAALGLGLALVRSARGPRQPAYRAVLIALLAAPTGGALVGIGITRVLFFVIPAAILTVLGVSFFLSWLEKRGLPRTALALTLFTGLVFINLAMTRDALANGPTWYHDYTLGGMQYGAQQVFSAIANYLQHSPGTKVILSPDWTNGADEVAHFFLLNSLPVKMESVEAYMLQRLPLDGSMLFVMLPEEYRAAASSGKFSQVKVEQTLPYPDGRPGFYFARMRYADNIAEILAAEQAARRELQNGQVNLDGQEVVVKYSLLDMGEIGAAFDGNPETLVRGLEANPLVIELLFPAPRLLSGASVRIGGAATRLTIQVTPSGGGETQSYTRQAGVSEDVRELPIDFKTPILADRLVFQVLNSEDTEPAHVHVWEIRLH